MSEAGIVVVANHGVPMLRAVLRNLRESVGGTPGIAVLADDCPEQMATFLVRKYLRLRLGGFELGHPDPRRSTCGLDRSQHLVRGEYLARVSDEFAFRAGWLERALDALEADRALGVLSLVAPSDYRRGRGRPRTVHAVPVPVDAVDPVCFVTRRELVARHCAACSGAAASDRCRLQEAARDEGLGVAFLPGLAVPSSVPSAAQGGDLRVLEADLPAHGGATDTMQRLEQAYQLGDDALLRCMVCDAAELEVLAARLKFCERHGVAIGYWYELRCPECGELHYKDDLQFRCPT